MKLGKLPINLLEEELRKIKIHHDDVILGPKVGEDNAIIDLGDRYMVVASDPITAAAENIGYFAVHINANDIAVAGAKPAYMAADILLPEHADAEMAREVFSQLRNACDDIGVSLVTGHTEKSPGLKNIIIASTMFGFVPVYMQVTTGGAEEFDDILVTKSAGLEGTAIIASDFAERLGFLSKDEIEEAKGYLKSFSVLPEARIAADYGVTSMHDPTEGGIANALHELYRASGVGVWALLDLVPVTPLTEKICSHLEINPYGLLSSGMLLATCEPSKTKSLRAAWKDAGIESTVIGHMEQGGVRQPHGRKLPYFRSDELCRLFE